MSKSQTGLAFPQSIVNPIPVSDSVGSRYNIDVIGPLKETKEGYKYILLIVESYSKFPEAFEMRTQEATEVADILYNNIICRYGVFDSLVSDRGTNFMSKVISRLCQLFDIKHIKTCAYHQQSNSIWRISTDISLQD